MTHTTTNTQIHKKQEIKKYANMSLWTDVEPYEVVKVVSEKCVEVRKMKAEMIQAPKDFHSGGFVGHFADNRDQKYTYSSDEDAPIVRIRWSQAKLTWRSASGNRFSMSDEPYKLYDFNF